MKGLPVKRKRWDRLLVLDGVEPASNGRSWYLNRLGRVENRRFRNYGFYRSFPASREDEGRSWWLTGFFKEVQRGIIEAVYRREWERAAVLLQGCFRKAFRKSLTFKQFHDRETKERFPAEDLMIATFTHLKGGKEVCEMFLEALLNDKVDLVVGELGKGVF